MLSIGRVLRSKSRSYLLHRPQRILSTSSTKVSTSSSTSDLEFDLDNVTKSLESTLSSVPEQTPAREFDMMSFLRSSSTQDRQEFRNEIEALKREEVRCRESGESDRERMIRQRRQEIDELNGLEKAMEDYSEMKNVLYDLGKASSFKAEQKLLVSWYAPLSKRIAEEQKRCQQQRNHELSRRLLMMNPEKLAILTIHKVLNLCVPSATGSAPFVDVSAAIGEAINTELHIDRLRKHKEVWDQLQRSTRSELEMGSRKALRRANRLAKVVLAGGVLPPEERIHGEEEEDENEWTKAFCVQIGSWLSQMLIEEAKIPSSMMKSSSSSSDDVSAVDVPSSAFGHVKKRKKRSQHLHGVLQMDMNLIKNLDTQHLLTSLYNPTFKPLLVPPRKWHAKDSVTSRRGRVLGGPSDGGYLLLRSQFMRTHGSKLQSELLTRAKLDRVYDALNVLGSTPWRVNERVLDVVKHKWENCGGGVAALPRRVDFEIPEVEWPERPEGEFATPERIAEYEVAKEESVRRFRYARKLSQHNSDLHSLRCGTTLKLDQAEELREEREIYFPFNVDFRGRVYPIPAHLNHMGDDLSRGLLTFAEKRPLGDRGLRWLKVQLANVYGEDKCSFEERVEFVNRNFDHVRASAERPNEYGWWLDADKPWQALAACIEINDAINHSGDSLDTFMSSLPVHQDGSCNGLQHYAALGRDRRGGAKVNLTSGDRPADVYAGVLDIVKEKVQAHLRGEDNASETEVVGTNGMTQQQVAGLVHDHLVRKTIKQTVMTTVYGVTFVGAKQQIYSQLRHLTEPGAVLEHVGDDVIYGASGYLAKLTLSSQGELFANANRMKEWLTTAADEVAKCGQPISWMTPMGLPVVQPYRHSTKHRVKTHMQDVTIAVSDDDLPVSKPRQKSAFPPNFVHSLDSTHMMMTALECHRRGLTYTAVHDSYWTHASNVDDMNEVLREEFVVLHSQPLLEQLRNSLVFRYPRASFPTVPVPGDLDLTEVYDSEYFFN